MRWSPRCRLNVDPEHFPIASTLSTGFRLTGYFFSVCSLEQKTNKQKKPTLHPHIVSHQSLCLHMSLVVMPTQTGEHNRINIMVWQIIWYYREHMLKMDQRLKVRHFGHFHHHFHCLLIIFFIAFNPLRICGEAFPAVVCATADLTHPLTLTIKKSS